MTVRSVRYSRALGVRYRVHAVWTSGVVVIQFGWLKQHRPFDSEETYRELYDRVNKIPGVRMELDVSRSL